MSSSGFQQKIAEQRSLEGRKIISYDDIGINQRSNLSPLWEHGEERRERNYRRAFHGYVDLDNPAEKNSTK